MRRTIALEIRWAEGRFERLPDLAVDLVRWRPHVLVATAPYGIQAARQAIGTIPIIMIACDPAEAIVDHVARPSGHITGVTCMSWDLTPNRLQLLKEAVPRMARVAVLYSAFDPNKAEELRQMRDPARTLGVSLLPDPLTLLQRQRIADLAARHRLPAMYGFKGFVPVGSLMAYGTMQDDLFRRAAAHVDKVLRGAKPADVPVEQASRFELVITLKSARALGLTVPPFIFVRADQVIQ